MEHKTSSPCEMGAHSHGSDMSSPAEMRAGSLDLHRSLMMDWVDIMENSSDDLFRIPPVSLILHRDLLKRAWGWERLLPNYHGTVDWHEFKRYVEEYLQFNTDKVAAGKDALHVAAKQCIETEKWLIKSCGGHLSFEDISLSTQIQKCARDLIQSDDGDYPAAAAALMSIGMEAKLIYLLLDGDIQLSRTLPLSSKVRRSASNLMLYKGPESAAAAGGAMVGLAIEARAILDSAHPDSPDPESTSHYVDFYDSHLMRDSNAIALGRLEEELACARTGEGLDSEGSGSMEKSAKKMDGQGSENENENEKMSKNLNNQTSSEEEAGEQEEVKVAGEGTLKDGTKGEASSTAKDTGKSSADTGDA